VTIQRIDRGRNHWYKIDGQKADGVTTLIGDGTRKKALEAWGIRSVAEYAAEHLDLLNQMAPMGREAIVSALKQSPYTDRDQAANRGTEVHKLAEELIHGREVEVPPELAGHVDSYVRYLDDWQPEPILVEATVAHRRWNYAGTLDSVYRLPDGRVVIADVKTSRSGIFAEAALQLAAYRFAEVYLDGDGDERPMADLGIGDVGHGLWIRGDRYDVLPIPVDESVWRAFLHIAFGARWMRDNKDIVGDPLPAPDWSAAPLALVEGGAA
jgi:ribosome-associated translation inhibitor RaiA